MAGLARVRQSDLPDAGGASDEVAYQAADTRAEPRPSGPRRRPLQIAGGASQSPVADHRLRHPLQISQFHLTKQEVVLKFIIDNG